jgi:succinate-semialdehyde dehydrogenase / glutarate-semialdehyde dehydrogenase
VRNPATGLTLGAVPDMGAAETARAIAAADRAWDGWRSMTAKARAGVMRRWFDLMMANQDDLAAIMTAEQGKPLAEARGEIAYAASFIEWFAEEGKRVYGDVIPATAPGRRLVVIKQPVGVVAAITPWNFPAAMITRKAGPALAAGCPIVIKPAPQTPFSALALCELAERAGIPPGIVQVVTGSAEAIGGEMTGNPTVRKLTFTGSTKVGKILIAQCAATVKKVSMELGGNAPFIVFDDADLEKAVKGAVASKFRNNGQTCVCANRILVQDGIHDAFVTRFASAVAGFKVGDGMAADTTQGPLIDENAVLKVEAHLADALAKGASLIAGGSRHPLGGTYFEPTIISGVTTEMRVAREETFGPLAPVFRFQSEAEAIRMANDTEFGLAAYVYTRDIGRIWRTGEALEYGIVGINEGVPSTEAAPFGGMKESGLGREGSYYGIEDYLEVKYLCLGGI